MKDLVIIGAGDFGREVSWIVERINAMTPTWNLLGFVDDASSVQGQMIDGYPVLGTTAWFQNREEDLCVVCSIGTGRIRKLVMERVLMQKNLHPVTLIDPSAIIGRDVQIEDGCVICAGTVLTVSIRLEAHTILNLNCTVGHDTIFEPYCTVHPSSSISGKVRIGTCTDIGTGVRIIQGLQIAAGCVLGAGAVVVKDITESGTYVGVPAKRMK